jgi:hypothetical protein
MATIKSIKIKYNNLEGIFMLKNNQYFLINLLLFLNFSANGMLRKNLSPSTKSILSQSYFGKNIIGESVDDLVLKGVDHIFKNGDSFKARAGSGQQAYNVTYIPTDSRDRLHLLRNPVSLKYLAHEFLAYFKGSLNVNDGLGQASPF